MRKVLVVDDDAVARDLLLEVLSKEGYDITLASSGEQAIDLSRESFYSLVVSDIRMLELDGLDVLKHFKKHSPKTVVILMTAFGSMETAVEAIKHGAFDYISKPFKIDAFKSVLKKAAKHAELLESPKGMGFENQLLTKMNDDAIGVMVGSSPKMLEIFKTIALAAMSQASVLITGESGTGKELIARAIHGNSTRRHSKFVAVNCGALTDTLLESELFGYVKGAFTGAQENRKGLFDEAHQGTLFLDEIGDISPATQVKLLRALQDGEIRPLGSTDSHRVDVRIICATHRNLQKMVADGTFREDLYYRLKVVSMNIPPLRERIEDIPELVNDFLPRYARKNQKRVSHLTGEALNALCLYQWPGNVRELQNTIERAVALARTSEIDIDDLPKEITESQYLAQDTNQDTKAVSSDQQSTTLESMEKQHILQVLSNVNFNKTKAADALGIDRATLYRKALKYGIDFKEK